MEGQRWVYFTDQEVKGLDTELVAMLDRARGMAKIAFEITSGYRDSDANGACGGVEDSSHCHGWAVDLSCQDSPSRLLMVEALLYVGFVRIGVYDHHIHVDNDATKPQKVMWVGVSH